VARQTVPLAGEQRRPVAPFGRRHLLGDVPHLEGRAGALLRGRGRRRWAPGADAVSPADAKPAAARVVSDGSPWPACSTGADKAEQDR